MTIAQVQLAPIQGIPGGYQGLGVANAPSTIEKIISNTVGFLTVAAGLTFVVYILLAGLTWITAREEAERMNRAKQMFVNALIGLAIVVSAWSFVGIMQTVFGFNILSPAQVLESLTPGGGATNSGGSSSGACGCYNGGCASIGQTAPISLGGACYQCTNTGWKSAPSGTTCAPISCGACQ